ncbi:MAG: M23 family metallopeptidase [Muribaculaceae bacterium]|nr:M23 family metallopeptidase [Muribaculaceae bacterium]
MKLNKKYRITLEDESSLEKKLNISARTPWLILLLIGLTVLAGAFGIFILASTPMKNYLPGYLREDQRTATEEQHMRLDSLEKIYNVNEAYIKGILAALNPVDSVAKETAGRNPTPLYADSLISASPEEKTFMENIMERDKYNISYNSPAAAQTMLFGSVNKAAVISQESKGKYQAELIVPSGAPVSTIADGKVISIASSPKTSGGYEVIIQHPKGFLSKSSRLTNLTVQPGDRVAAGQVIALGTAKGGMKSNRVLFELWHDGDPLIPSRYLNGGAENPE